MDSDLAVLVANPADNRLTDEVNLLHEAGFAVLYTTTMMCEDTFVFASKELATAAYDQFEGSGDGRVQGWWYGLREFWTEYDRYCRDIYKLDTDSYPLIFKWG